MAYLALYRLYRPTMFGEIVGQQTITRTLKNQVAQDRIGHAYLLCGSRGTGKTSTAKVFARAINCQNPQDGEPCGICSICQMSDSDLSMDIVEIDAASNNGVDEIRDLRDKVKFAPAVCKYRVYIIDEVHMLSSGAFNALLKTLEEPPEHTVFILATTEAHKLPATILSRCQRFDFKRIPLPVLEEQLNMVVQKQGITADAAAISAIAKAAEGGMRDALSLLDQCIGFAGDTLTYDDVLMILGATDDETLGKMQNAIEQGDAVTAMHLLEQVYDAGKDLQVFARDLTERFADAMMQLADKKQDASFAMQAVSTLSQARTDAL